MPAKKNSSDLIKIVDTQPPADWIDCVPWLAERHHLPQNEELDLLLNTLIDIMIIDQDLPSGKAATFQRQEVTKAARDIRKYASQLIEASEGLRSSLKKLQHAITVEKDGTFMWSTVMLSQVFDVSKRKRITFELPDGLEALRVLMCSDQQWDTKLQIVKELADLPVRPKVSSGVVPDPVLQPALLACRNYWVKAGKNWTRGDIAEGVFRDESAGARAEDLRKPAEAFVIDALRASKIRFTLKRLNSAWVEMDEAMRDGRIGE